MTTQIETTEWDPLSALNDTYLEPNLINLLTSYIVIINYDAYDFPGIQLHL